MRGTLSLAPPPVEHLSGATPVVVPASAVAAPVEFAEILASFIENAGGRPRERGEALRLAHLNMALRAQSPTVDATGSRSWWAW